MRRLLARGVVGTCFVGMLSGLNTTDGYVWSAFVNNTVHKVLANIGNLNGPRTGGTMQITHHVGMRSEHDAGASEREPTERCGTQNSHRG